MSFQQQLAPFDGTNFGVWIKNVKSALIINKVLDAIDPSKEAHPPDNWDDITARAWLIFSGSITPNVMNQFGQCETPLSLWEALHNVYNLKDDVKETALLLKFCNTKRASFSTCSEYVAEMRMIINQFEAAGGHMEEKNKWRVLLSNLGSQYESFINSYSTLPSESMTLQIMGNRICMLDQVDTPEEINGSAYRAIAQPQLVCRFCKATGHDIKSCSRVKCRICGQRGHLDLKCKSSKNNNNSNNSNIQSDEVYSQGTSTWFLDSGATHSMTPHKYDFEDEIVQSTMGYVYTASGQRLEVMGIGQVKIENTIIPNILYVPELGCRLMSVSQLIANGYAVHFEKNTCKVTKGKITNFEIVQDSSDGLFKFKPSAYLVRRNNQQPKTDTATNWHRKMGHIHHRAVVELFDKELVSGGQITDRNEQQCEPCILGKSTSRPQSQEAERTPEKPAEIISADLMVISREDTGAMGEMNALVLVDHYSGYVQVQTLFTKDSAEIVRKLRNFVKLIENQTGDRAKIFRTDNGLEFCNTEVNEYLGNNGIRHEQTAPHNSAGNGRSERMIRTLRDYARTMLIATNMDRLMWPWAFRTAAYLHNRCGKSPFIDKTPYEIIYSIKPDISKLEEFGTKCWVKTDKRSKWSEKCTPGRLIGYGDDSECYVVKADDDRIVHSKDVTFTRPSNPEMEPVVDAPRKSDRPKTFTGSYAMAVQYTKTAIPEKLNSEPTLKEALESPNAKEWQEAINEEFKNLMEKGVFDTNIVPEDKKVLKSRVILKMKEDALGTFTRYKARLVACGYAQREGLDYSETFAPTVKPQTLRALLAVAASKDYLLHQMDVDTAYLNADLKEEIYIRLPKDIKSELAGRTVKLKKSLYGLKQAGHEWYSLLHSMLEKLDWKRSEADYCLYKRSKAGQLQYLAVYVDDILMSAKTADEINLIKEEIKRIFKVKDLGEAKSILGMSVERPSPNVILLSQTGLINKVLKTFQNIYPIKIRSTPTDKALPPHTGNATDEEILHYQQVVGALLHLSRWTRPDISTAVSHASRYASNPGPDHMKLIGQILGYLLNTAHHKFRLCGHTNQVILHTDSDWAGDITDYKSQSGCAVFLGNNLIAWKSNKQSCVARSTMEAEYIAMSEGTSEAQWCKYITDHLETTNEMDPIAVYCDNQAALAALKNPAEHSKAKHIALKYHCIRDEERSGRIKSAYIPTQSNIADIFTKGLTKTRHSEITRSLGIGPWGSISAN